MILICMYKDDIGRGVKLLVQQSGTVPPKSFNFVCRDTKSRIEPILSIESEVG